MPDNPTSPDVQQVIDRFWEAVPSTWSTVRERIRRKAAEQFGITEEQFHILRHVLKGANSVSQLAEMQRISRSAISQAVDVLVEKGLLARAHDCADRRSVRLSLTEEGSSLIGNIFRLNRAWMAEKLAPLNPEELAALERGLELLKTLKKE